MVTGGDLLEKMRLTALMKNIPYSYTTFCQKLDIPEGQVENMELYQQGLELIASGYTPKPAEITESFQTRYVEPNNPQLEEVIDENTPKIERITNFLQQANSLFSLSTQYTVFTQDKIDILKRSFPGRFGKKGSQPLLLTTMESSVEGIKKYTPFEIGIIFENVYKFYSEKLLAKKSR